MWAKQANLCGCFDSSLCSPLPTSDTHTAQLYRYMILYEHGGFFMDTEMLVMNPLDDIPQNSLSYEFDGLHPPTPGSSTIKVHKHAQTTRHPLLLVIVRARARTRSLHAHG